MGLDKKQRNSILDLLESVLAASWGQEMEPGSEYRYIRVVGGS